MNFVQKNAVHYNHSNNFTLAQHGQLLILFGYYIIMIIFVKLLMKIVSQSGL